MHWLETVQYRSGHRVLLSWLPRVRVRVGVIGRLYASSSTGWLAGWQVERHLFYLVEGMDVGLIGEYAMPAPS